MNSYGGIVVTALMLFLCVLAGQASVSEPREGQVQDKRFKERHRLRRLVHLKPSAVLNVLRAKSLPLLIGLVGFCLGYFAFKLTGVALSLGLMAWASYYKVNKLLRAWHTMKIQRELPQFFGMLQGWSEVNNNLLYCIEKVADSGLSACLIQPYKQCLREAKSGVPLEKTLERLRAQTPTDTQKHFVFCLMETNRRQGKLSELFKGFEAEASQIWLEIQRTSLLRLQYRLLIYGLSHFAILLLYMLLKYNHALGSFYLQTALGRQVLTGLSFISACIYLREAVGGGTRQ